MRALGPHMEVFMAFVTADVVPDTGGEAPFKVVFKQGETVLAEWPVESQAKGEEEIAAAVRGLMEEGEEEEND
jgi:hypothetical protein